MSDDELAQALSWRELTEEREERLSLLRLSQVVSEEDEGKTKAKPTLFLHKGEDVDIICVGQCIGIQAEGYGSRPLVKHESR